MLTDEHRDLLPLGRREVLAASAAGAVLLGLAGARPASADPAFDVQLLQTAASVENALVGTYDGMLALPLLASPPAEELKNLLSTARDHHVAHAEAVNAAARQLGGQPQTAANAAVAQAAGGGRSGDLDQVLDLAQEAETVAAQTYQNTVGLLGDPDARKLAASILAVESQHAAWLVVARSLVTANLLELTKLDSGSLDRVPADAGRAGAPQAFTTVDQARPPAEGAVG